MINNKPLISFSKIATLFLVSIILTYLTNLPIKIILWSDFNPQGNWTAFILAISALFFILFLPILIIKHLFKKDPFFYGLRLPENFKQSFLLTAFTTLFFVLIVFIISKNTEFQSYYLIRHSITWFFLLEIFFSFLYFLAEEFFFRGFLFFSFYEEMGQFSYILTNLIFSLLHIGKPTPELFFAFFMGIILSYITSKTRSILPATIIHFITALVLNLFIVGII